MRAITKIVVHHSVSPRDQTLEKSLASFNENHKRLHPTPNSLGLFISYHYVIAGDGRWAKTRGLEEVGYHASNPEVNNTSIGICLTGNFDIEHPTEYQCAAFKYLRFELERKFGKLDLHFHNEFTNKSCPGKHVTKILFDEVAEEPKKEYTTKEQVQSIVRWELTKHRLQYHAKKSICEHGEVLPVGEFSAGDISTINGFKRVKPSPEGTLYWKLMDYPEELGKYSTIRLFNNVFGDILRELKPTAIKKIEKTDKEDQAQIRLYFRRPGDPILPQEFKEQSLAFGIAPHDGEHSGKVFFNEKYDRSKMCDPDGYRLYKVALHEILHAFNLAHSSNPDDIMYYMYNKGDHDYIISENTKKLFQMLY